MMVVITDGQVVARFLCPKRSGFTRKATISWP